MTFCDVDKCPNTAEWTGIWESQYGGPSDGKRWNWCDDCYLESNGFRVLCTKQIEVLLLTPE